MVVPSLSQRAHGWGERGGGLLMGVQVGSKNLGNMPPKRKESSLYCVRWSKIHSLRLSQKDMIGEAFLQPIRQKYLSQSQE